MHNSPESRDLIATLGYLCLGSRLKRLGERMQAGVAQQLAAAGHAVLPAHLPILWALREEAEPMTIGALGERMGISQPGVSRAVATLEGMGLVVTARAGRDKRLRRIAISDTGEALMADLSVSLFPAVQQAVETLCLGAGPDLLGGIDRIEDDLVALSLDARIGALLGETQGG